MRVLIRSLLLVGLLLSGTATAPLALADDAAPVPSTRITGTPDNPSTSGRATFTWDADVPSSTGVRFECRLTGPGHPSADFMTCGSTSGQTSTTTTTATATFRGLAASRTPYRFTVRAVLPAAAGADPQPPGSEASYSWRVFSVFAPHAYDLTNGPSFNRPLSRSAKRVNLDRVIRTVNAMPGYREAYPGLCPSAPGAIPGVIRVSLYSMFDRRFANAMVAARQRCLSVQILMNNHLNRQNDPSWGTLEDALGTRVFDKDGRARTSFAHRCNFACRGRGVLHTKMYLFNSTLRDSRFNKIRNAVLVGSSNMTSNASNIQWNDLFAQRGNAGLFATFSGMFDRLKLDNGFHPEPRTVTNGNFQTTFMPQRSLSDPYERALGAIRCTGATGGAGIRGRTLVSINMHAWFGTRGMALANRVRGLYAHGCYVRVLYSFMSFKVFKKLERGTGSRMSVRRTIFSHDNKTAYVYSHFKNIDISGHVGSDRSARLVYTGSNNFTNDGLRSFDEVIVRIASTSAYRAYSRQFGYIRDRLSSATYANFAEPTGGGRAPDDPTTRKPKAAAGAPAGTPTIQSPEVTVGKDGQAHVLD